MSSVIMPPPPAVLALCDCVDEAIKSFLRAYSQRKVVLGRFEAETEAYILHKLVIRHAEAFALLARHDLVLLPAAHVTARAAFEAHLKIMWLLKPVDPFEQEARWVLHLKSAVEHWTKLANGAGFEAAFRNAAREQANLLECFAGKVSKLLVEQGYAVPSKATSVWDMLKEQDQKQLYNAYVQLSSYTHANFEAASLYRRNLGNAKELGEFIRPADWAFPIEIVWKSLFVTSRRILSFVESPENVFPEEKLHGDFLHQFELLVDGRH